jgi:DNA replication initiation complex subunit (GINS family)
MKHKLDKLDKTAHLSLERIKVFAKLSGITDDKLKRTISNLIKSAESALKESPFYEQNKLTKEEKKIIRDIVKYEVKNCVDIDFEKPN